MKLEKLSYVPGLYKIYDEILGNNPPMCRFYFPIIIFIILLLEGITWYLYCNVLRISVMTISYWQKLILQGHKWNLFLASVENVLTVARRPPEICSGYLILVAGSPTWLPRNLMPSLKCV